MKKLFYSLSIITLAVISGYVINGVVTAPKEKKGVVTQVKEELGRWKFDWQQRGKGSDERQAAYREQHLTPRERMERERLLRQAPAATALQDIQPRVIAPSVRQRTTTRTEYERIQKEAAQVRPEDYILKD